MKNIKSEIYETLLSVTKNVTDIYPPQYGEFPAIQFAEEQNSVYKRGDNVERMSRVRYRIDIYDERSVSDLALRVDDAMSKLGLRRIWCKDIPDPEQIKHKQMRYEGIISMSDDVVYTEF